MSRVLLKLSGESFADQDTNFGIESNTLTRIADEISKANEKTSSLEVREFRMIPKELDHEEGELTATQKVKRNVLIEQFSDLIEEMYS